MTGILRRVGRAVYLEPDDPRIAADYGRVQLDSAPSGKDGDSVVVEITRYPDAVRRELAGNVIKVLGDPDDPRTEIEKILAVSMIPIEFPEYVRPNQDEIHGRRIATVTMAAPLASTAARVSLKSLYLPVPTSRREV